MIENLFNLERNSTLYSHLFEIIVIDNDNIKLEQYATKSNDFFLSSILSKNSVTTHNYAWFQAQLHVELTYSISVLSP